MKKDATAQLTGDIQKILDKYLEQSKDDTNTVIDNIKLSLTEMLAIYLALEGTIYGDKEKDMMLYCDEFSKLFKQAVRANFRDMKKKNVLEKK